MRSGNIVGGHQRIEAIDAIYGTNDYRLRVAQVELTDEQERAANLALNNPEAQGDWDLEKLSAILKTPNLDVKAAGFDTVDVYRILGENAFVEHASQEDVEEMAQRLRDRRADYDRIVNTAGKKNESNFYTVFVFRDDAGRARFHDTFELDDNRFQDGEELLARLTVEHEPEDAEGAGE